MEIFLGLFAVAGAFFFGLLEIAGAIRNRRVDVNFTGPITIKGYHDE